MAEPRERQIRRGEVYWVDWSPARGSEPARRKPAVVIQGDAGNQSQGYPNTIVAMVSTHGREIPLHVRLRPRDRTGLRQTSFVKCEQIMTIPKQLLSKDPIGRLHEREMAEVESAILLSLGLCRGDQFSDGIEGPSNRNGFSGTKRV